MAAELRVGTSGWHYAHWAGGVFYPDGMGSDEWLGHYAKSFDSVEINNTFYHLPREETFESWRRAVPEGFEFAVKASRFITHVKRLKEPGEGISRFLSRAGLLREKLGPVLFQLPPSMERDEGRLRAALEYLSEQRVVPQVHAVFEFRNASWLVNEVYEELERHGAALCVSDLEVCPVERPLDSGFVYVRRHGPTGPYMGSYTDEQLRSDAAKIRNWLKDERAVHVYFNNDAEGYAVKNALRLKELVSG